MQTADIIKLITKEQLEQKKQALTNYYVPYDVSFIEQGFDIEVFSADRGRTTQLVLKYDSMQNGIKQPQNIVLANGNTGKVRIDNTKKQLNRFFASELQKYATLSGLEPERYIEYMQNMGWELTKEAWEVFSRTRTDDKIEIKRTEFTNQELENITLEDIKQNQKDHNLRREQQVISSISEYIKSSYQKVGFEDIKQLGITSEEGQSLKQKCEEVIQYEKSDKDSDDKLSKLFRTFKPISLSTASVSEEVSSYIQPILEYIRQIPSKYQDEDQYDYIHHYLVIRAETMKEKAAGREIPSEIGKLSKYINIIDENDERRNENTRLRMKNKVQKLINMHNQQEINL